ncbi:Carbonic anhydrase 2 [Phytophthora cinnamomi]|uniref:Carbonic anhydrase 2 n=1 Tax=Phytophthora cinnamomi TaxID=4785 RepID=UPI0035594066|nr:Carbonic anhydrase 2 [Phytophthora cinnamomi]
MVQDDFHVDISESTISRHLVGKLYTVKQTRVEPVTCNSEINKEKQKLFAKALIKHEERPRSSARSSAYGVVAYRTHKGSIKMQNNADFVDALYKVIKASKVYANEYQDKYIVVVFDNAPTHSRTEELVPAHDDLVL